MTVIFIIIGILFLVLLGWTWNNLGSIEKPTKVACIIGGIVFVYIITFIIYNISKMGITYESKEAMRLIQTVFVMLFTIINGYIILPFTFKKLDKINNKDIEKDEIKSSIVIVVIIIIILGILESSYFGNLQDSILNMMNK